MYKLDTNIKKLAIRTKGHTRHSLLIGGVPLSSEAEQSLGGDSLRRPADCETGNAVHRCCHGNIVLQAVRTPSSRQSVCKCVCYGCKWWVLISYVSRSPW